MLQTTSSLALRALLKTGVARAGLGRSAPVITGLSAPAVGFHAAAASLETPVFLVVPADSDVEQVTCDARFFLSHLEVLSAAAAERAVLALPSQEVDPYRAMATHLEVASARARALHGLSAGTARIVVASARALLPRLSDPARLRDAGFTIAPGDEIGPQDLGEKLVIAGFSPEDPVDEHGEFCVRGGVLDFYPDSDSIPISLDIILALGETSNRYDTSARN